MSVECAAEFFKALGDAIEKANKLPKKGIKAQKVQYRINSSQIIFQHLLLNSNYYCNVSVEYNMSGIAIYDT